MIDLRVIGCDFTIYSMHDGGHHISEEEVSIGGLLQHKAEPVTPRTLQKEPCSMETLLVGLHGLGW